MIVNIIIGKIDQKKNVHRIVKWPVATVLAAADEPGKQFDKNKLSDETKKLKHLSLIKKIQQDKNLKHLAPEEPASALTSWTMWVTWKFSTIGLWIGTPQILYFQFDKLFFVECDNISPR